eukprot:CFRG4189T1
MSESETKRFNHNALERKRRIIQKDRLQELRDLLPDVSADKPSTMEILQKASSYIHRLDKHTTMNNTKVENLMTRNTDLMSRLAAITKSRSLPWPSGQPTNSPVNSSDWSRELGVPSSRKIQPSVGSSPHNPAPPPPSLSYGSSLSPHPDGLYINGRHGFNRSPSSESGTIDNGGTPPVKQEFTKPINTGRSEAITSTASHVSQSLPINSRVEDCVLGNRKRSVHVVDNNPHTTEARHRKISRSETGDERDDDLESEAALLREFSERSMFSMDMDVDRRVSPDSSAKGMNDASKLPCRCGKPWDGKPMVMCEECKRWLHGTCVGGFVGRQHPVNYVCVDCELRANH